jgi:hypothetical protein
MSSVLYDELMIVLISYFGVSGGAGLRTKVFVPFGRDFKRNRDPSHQILNLHLDIYISTGANFLKLSTNGAGEPSG